MSVSARPGPGYYKLKSDKTLKRLRMAAPNKSIWVGGSMGDFHEDPLDCWSPEIDIRRIYKL